MVKIKALEQTISFYKWELEKKEMTEKERDKYLKALKIIEKIIKEKERSGEKRKSECSPLQAMGLLSSTS